MRELLSNNKGNTPNMTCKDDSGKDHTASAVIAGVRMSSEGT